MKHKAAPGEKDSLRLFFLFCGSVALLILGSLLVKTFYTIRDSRYDPRHAFVLSIETKDGVVFYNIDPEKKEFSALRITVSDEELNPGQDLGIPVDTNIQLHDIQTERVRLKSILPTLIFKNSSFTWYDIVRLMLTTSRMNEDTLHDESMQFQSDKGGEIRLDRRFYDQDIVSEEASIAIVNATGVSGVGSRLETVISHLGGSVISVTTSPQGRQDSAIYYNDSSLYTVEKLQKFLDFPIMEKADLTASDIIIIIGEDGLTSPKF